MMQVCLLNLDKLTKNTLQYFFSNQLADMVTVSEQPQKADVLFVSNHENLGEHFFDQLSERKQHVVMLYMKTAEVFEHGRVHWLKRPLETQQLLQQLARIKFEFEQEKMVNNVTADAQETATKLAAEEQVIASRKQQNHKLSLITAHQTKEEKAFDLKDHKYVGSNSNIAIDDELSNYIHPEKYLFFYLLKALRLARAKQCAVEIETCKGVFYCDHQTQSFMHNISPQHIDALHNIPIFENTQVAPFASKLLYQKGLFAHSRDFRWVWETMLQTIKGRLPVDTNIQQPVIMTQWPNFTRLTAFNHAIRIAAFWSKNQQSLYQTAAELHVPQRYVFTLYTAMHIIGYADLGTQEMAQSMKPNTKNSIFSRIMNHLFVDKTKILKEKT